MFNKKFKKNFFFFLLICFCLNIIYLSRPYTFNDRQLIWRVILSPSISAKTIFNQSYQFFKSLFYTKEILNENMHLKRKVEALSVENQLLKKDLENLKHLSIIEDYTKKFPFSVEVSYVVGRNPEFWHQYLLINGGKDRNFSYGMPVITKDGLIGKIVEVYDNYSKVLLLIDPEFSVDVRGENSRVLALCSGIGTSVLKINYVPKFEELVLGETLVTSGLDGAFPEGIPVGYVIEINKPFGDYFLDAYVVPSVDILKVKEVIVIKSFTRKQK